MSVHRLTLVFGLLYFFQGLGDPTDGLLAQPVQAMLKSWGTGQGEIASFAALLALPWSLKPLYGLLTDYVPLAGLRRKSYLAATAVAALVGFGLLAVSPPSSGAYGWLLLLLLPTIGVAFADVVVDALMIEHGQPLGLTGRLQSVQWATIYGAAICTGVAGGYLSRHEMYRTAFAICALVAIATLAVALGVVREPPRPATLAGPRSCLTSLRKAILNPAICWVGLFMVLFEFNPFATSVQYWHMTKVLEIGEQHYGNTRAISAVASIAACIAYSNYCRRVPMRWLLHGSMALGIVGTASYWGLSGPTSACVVSLVFGFTYMTAVLVQLDLAAQICPTESAGTVFALIMSLANLSSSLATLVGGRLYEHWAARWSPGTGFHLLVAMGMATTALCWLVVPKLTRSVRA
jgi:MFS family permease